MTATSLGCRRRGGANALVALALAVGLALAVAAGAAHAAPIGPHTSAHPDLDPPRLSSGARRPAEGLAAAAATSPGEPATLASRGGARQAPGAAPAASPVRVGLQAGHWRAAEAPPPLNTQTGSSGRGKSEAEVNLPIALAAAATLRAAGCAVDVLPTVIPKGYRADLVVAIHSDGGPASRRGFFVDHSPRLATASAEARLGAALEAAYQGLGIPNVFRGTEASRYYYGYYAVDPRTPMVLIEGGFLTNASDQRVLVDDPDAAGAAIARGILDYLGMRVN